LLVSRRIRKRNALKKNNKDAQSALEEQLLELEFAAQMGELEEKLIIEEVDEVLDDETFNDIDSENEWSND
jgi:pantothenate synthetase